MRLNEGSCQLPKFLSASGRRPAPAPALCLRAHTSHTVIPHGPLAWLQRYPSGTNDITIAREREQTRHPSVASHSPAAQGLHTNAALRDCR
jgi:hypothetical protein